jgi:hypothetical protein
LEGKTQGHQKAFKSHLVKFASKILLKIFGISNWGVEVRYDDSKKCKQKYFPKNKSPKKQKKHLFFSKMVAMPYF